MIPPDAPVMLVEDSEDDVLLITRAARLARLAHPLRVLRDGDAAVAYFEGRDTYADRGLNPLPRLVLLDLKLPRRSGFEVLTWLRMRPEFKRLPVVVLTSSSQSADVERAYELGANTYLVKPVAFDALHALLESVDAYWFRHATLPSSG